VKITTKTEYLFKYSNYYTYHPFHAMSMISVEASLTCGLPVSFLWARKRPSTPEAWDSFR